MLRPQRITEYHLSFQIKSLGYTLVVGTGENMSSTAAEKSFHQKWSILALSMFLQMDQSSFIPIYTHSNKV